jgi:hypothetical protein
LDDIYHGAAPLESRDRRAYFIEVQAMLGACSDPPSHSLIRNIVKLAQKKYNCMVERTLVGPHVE